MAALSQESWRRACVLFDAALDQPETQRHEFVRRACGQDEDLFDAVTSLLALDRESAPEMSIPAISPPHTHIGRYRILRPIGRGGMSRVYLGERIDGDVEQRVAIKLIGDTDQPKRLDLFRRERQILARLEHPYVARFLDAGAAQDGTPYVVMEYVEGFPLTEYCDTLRLNVPQRLELFLKVCAAVEYAHRNLVVHRDLKPANILVTDAGEPKLLDFGIAKLLDRPMVSGMTTQERFLTPDYASPEQLSGRGVTTASDVYSLGVLLHELLTGCLPHRLRGQSAIEAMTTLERTPRPPSERASARGEDEGAPEVRAAARSTTPARLRRRLAGDLDNIVACCLSAAPQERYSSVERLAEDLRRHLRGLPVFVRPPRLLYRSVKFVRRHVVAVVAAGVAVVALAAFVTSTILYSQRVTRERDLAREARLETEQVTRHLTGAFRFADVYQSADLGRAPGTKMTMGDYVDYWAENVEQELQGKPLLQARVKFTLGEVYHNMGSTEQALRFLREALTTRRRFDAETLEVVQSLNGLGSALADAGRLDKAELLLREALEISRTSPSAGHVLGDSFTHLGLLLIERNDYAAAEPLLRQALATRQTLDGPISRLVAEAWMNLGAALIYLKDWDAAEASQREALKILYRVVGDEHPDVATAMSYLGTTLVKPGHYGEAELMYRESLEMQRRLLGSEHPETLDGQAKLAEYLSYRGAYAEAAEAQSVLGECLAGLGRFEEAEELLVRSLSAIESSRGPSRQTRSALRRLVRFYEARGRHEVAGRYRARLDQWPLTPLSTAVPKTF